MRELSACDWTGAASSKLVSRWDALTEVTTDAQKGYQIINPRIIPVR
jgi:hypothetical protein